MFKWFKNEGDSGFGQDTKMTFTAHFTFLAHHLAEFSEFTFLFSKEWSYALANCSLQIKYLNN